jgi:hypothetical protein
MTRREPDERETVVEGMCAVVCANPAGVRKPEAAADFVRYAADVASGGAPPTPAMLSQLQQAFRAVLAGMAPDDSRKAMASLSQEVLSKAAFLSAAE